MNSPSPIEKVSPSSSSMCDAVGGEKAVAEPQSVARIAEVEENHPWRISLVWHIAVPDFAKWGIVKDALLYTRESFSGAPTAPRLVNGVREKYDNAQITEALCLAMDDCGVPGGWTRANMLSRVKYHLRQAQQTNASKPVQNVVQITSDNRVDPTACPECIGMGCDACNRTGDSAAPPSEAPKHEEDDGVDHHPLCIKIIRSYSKACTCGADERAASAPSAPMGEEAIPAAPVAWMWTNPDGSKECTFVKPEDDSDFGTVLALELGRKAVPLYASPSPPLAAPLTEEAQSVARIADIEESYPWRISLVWHIAVPDLAKWGIVKDALLYTRESFAHGIGSNALSAPLTAEQDAKQCQHHYVRDDEHPTHHCCQKCGKVARDSGEQA